MTNKKHILVVDDNPDNLRLIGSILKEEGYKIALALRGPNALDLLEKYDIDLVLLDLMMPEMDGIEVCWHIKNKPHLSDTPVIFITASNETPDLLAAFQAGGVDYITKPYIKEELLIRIKTHIELAESRKRISNLLKAQDKLYSIIAHDLRSPFNGIIGTSNLLLENFRTFDAEKTEHFLSNIHTQSRNTLMLLDNLLNWSKYQSGQLQYAPLNFNLIPIVAKIAEEVNPLAEIKNISIRLTHENEVVVHADPNMVSIILRNLATNAIKYTWPGGTIGIKVISGDKHAEISIVDDGIGMNEEIRKNLLSGGSTVSQPGTAREKGSGLGLMLCREFIEKQGGCIHVKSEPGKGSEFIFTLALHHSYNLNPSIR